MSAIDVSVIIPTYNRLPLLKRAIASCKAEHCRLEVIVVDDGSTDGTWEWLQSQPHVKSFYQENQGQAWAVLKGFELSQGSFIRFLDSDDFLADGAVDCQWRLAQDKGVDIVYGAVDRYCQDSGNVLPEPDPGVWDDFIAVQLGEHNGSHYLGMQFRRSLFVKVPPRRPEFSYRDDRMLLLELGLCNPLLARSPGVAGYWTKHQDQMHDNYRGIQKLVAHWQMLGIYRRTLQALIQRNELTPRRARAACNVLWPLAHQIAIFNIEEGWHVYEWIRSLDQDFSFPNQGTVGFLYRTLGFKATERLLTLRRTIISTLGMNIKNRNLLNLPS